MMQARSFSPVALLLVVAACSVSQDQEVEMGKEDAAQIETEVPLLGDSAIDSFVG